jgi:hypothetical protein
MWHRGLGGIAVDHRERARNVIRTLESESFYCDCPDCQEQMLSLRDAGLFYLNDFTPEAAERYKAMREQLRERRQEIARCQASKAKPIRLPRGKGIANSLLVSLDSPTVEEERERARLTRKAMRCAASPTSDKPQVENVVPGKASSPKGKAQGIGQ